MNLSIRREAVGRVFVSGRQTARNIPNGQGRLTC